MNRALVDSIVSAVLYEGYMLYPYRPSSAKNRQRWTFGGIYPRAYSERQRGSDAWAMQTECLVEGDEHATLDVTVRFLHLLMRQVGELERPLAELPPQTEIAYRPVAALHVDGQLFHAWQEAVEREIAVADMSLGELAAQPHQKTFSFPAWRALEPLRESGGAIVGVLAREQQQIEGTVELRATCMGERLFKITVLIQNLTDWHAGEETDRHERDEALLRAFASTHTILSVRGGGFMSLLDPPEHLRAIAEGCKNIGAWPVLVGEAGARDTMLASPIILYDYPQVAPESPGDLFDGTEIDEMLTLRVMTMTDEEKREMRAVDERARALLERTETLSDEELRRLHGAVRSLRMLREKP